MTKVPAYKGMARAGHIAGLDGFRGLAVILVLLFHSVVVSHEGRGRVIEALGQATRFGWLGVDMFFTLSGFLITGILLNTVDAPGYFRSFYVRRSLRIFPLYYGVLVLLCVLFPLLHLAWRGTLGYFLLDVQNYLPDHLTVFTHGNHDVRLSHFWSLAVEEQFYLVWPLVVWLLRGYKQAFMVVIAVLIIGCPIARGVAYSAGVAPKDMYTWTPFVTDTLAWGALGALLQRTLSSDALRWCRRSFVAAGCIGLVAYFIADFGVAGWLDSVSLRFAGPAMGMLSCGVILSISHVGSALGSAFALRPLRWFGKYSYGIYVYHFLFSAPNGWVRDQVEVLTGSRSAAAIAFIASYFVIGCGLAYASYHLFEKHFLRLKTTLAPEPRSVHAFASAD